MKGIERMRMKKTARWIAVAALAQISASTGLWAAQTATAQSNVFSLRLSQSGVRTSAGEETLIWNAAADLPDGFECERVVVEGSVE